MDPNASQPPMGTIVPPSIPQVQNLPARNNKKIYIIVGVIIFLLIGIGVATILILRGNNKYVKEAVTPTVAFPTPTPFSEKFHKEVILKKKVPVDVPEAKLVLTYRESMSPETGCFDCIATTSIKVKSGDKESILSYSCGGFSGECVNSREASGYIIKILEDVDADTMKVLITEK